MVAAAADLRAKQVDDRFEIIPRPRPPDPSLQEWRIRCLDCPGKVSISVAYRWKAEGVVSRWRCFAPGSARR